MVLESNQGQVVHCCAVSEHVLLRHQCVLGRKIQTFCLLIYPFCSNHYVISYIHRIICQKPINSNYKDISVIHIICCPESGASTCADSACSYYRNLNVEHAAEYGAEQPLALSVCRAVCCGDHYCIYLAYGSLGILQSFCYGFIRKLLGACILMAELCAADASYVHFDLKLHI